MTFVISVASEPEKFEEYLSHLSCPNLEIMIEDPANEPQVWESYKEKIGNAVVSYIKENYYDKNPCEGCPMWGDHHDLQS